MIIKTVGDMRKALSNLDDDYTFEVDLFERLSDEQLRHMIYPWPYNRKNMALQFNDVGVSDKVACFGVYYKDDNLIGE